ncbi:LPXTG cell wall anchor domain-containing protein [Planomicrobium sp. CPCC 101110]|nr:LPXTG cell wall anchor domain-containing protein [Planomicrobium sp. CPCC 101110]
MKLGSENYHYENSYFVVIHPFTYAVIGILIVLSAVTFILYKKKKK